MKTKTRLVLILSLVAALLALSLAACGTAAKTAEAEESSLAAAAESTEVVAEEPAADADNVQPTAEATAETAAEASVLEADLLSAQETEPAAAAAPSETIVTTANVTSDGVIDASELFADRDLTQTPDLSEAEVIAVADGEDVLITEGGVYVLQGTASGVTVYVETDQADDAKVQIVLDGVSITNEDFPCIYVKEADKVFVTTTATENNLSVTGTFVADGDTNTDGVIFCRSDLVLSGLGTLNISSTNNGVVCKDDLKITGGTYSIDAASKSLEANGTDALHAENDDDDTVGYIYICGGSFTINAGDDGIHAVSALQIDGGDFSITAGEGIEATYIQINDGDIVIDSQDDGINGAWKSSAYNATVEINGGNITVTMASGDTDGIDCNGDLIITGGYIDVTGRSTFDCDGSVTFTGGTVICNGTEVDSIPTQMGGRGGW